VRAVRVVVWDSSPSIRSIVRRTLSALDGVEVVEWARMHGEAGPVPGTGVLVLGVGAEGVDPGTLERWTLGSGLRIVLLTSPGPIVAMERWLARSGEKVTVLPKPSTSEGWERFGPQLAALVRDIASAAARSPGTSSWKDGALARHELQPRGRFRLAVAGGSSGGPAALHAIIAGMKGGSPPGLAVVQHISPGFEVEMIRWLARDLEMDVAIATDGERLGAGTIRIAPSQAHLLVDERGLLRLDRVKPPRNGHRPSVDELFFSIREERLEGTVAILLDGMGRDGVAGLKRIREGGGMTIVQDPRSCVIGGMPLAAIEENAALRVLEPEAIGRFLGGCGGGEAR